MSDSFLQSFADEELAKGRSPSSVMDSLAFHFIGSIGAIVSRSDDALVGQRVRENYNELVAVVASLKETLEEAAR